MEEITLKETIVGRYKNPFLSSSKNNRLEEILNAQKSGELINVICLSSMTFDKVLTEAIKGLEHYEMRCLWEISRVKNGNVHVHFFSKRKVHQEAIRHFSKVFDLTNEELERIHFYSVEEILKTTFLPEDLSDYIKDFGAVAREFKKICSLNNAYLECFVLTEKEKHLVDNYNIPTWWSHEDLDYYKTKSGNRKILRGVTAIPRGIENLHSYEESLHALKNLSHQTNARRFVIKLNDGVSGDGNGFINLKNGGSSIIEALENINFVSPKMTTEKFFTEMRKLGGVIEEFIEGENKRSPSVQLLLSPNGDFEILSSHEQILDESGSRFLGSEFPAKEDHRESIMREAEKVAKKLCTLNLSGIVGLDFLTVKNANGLIETYLIEMNIRKGGTTHPYWSARTALGALPCPVKGTLRKGKKEWVYRSNDNLSDGGGCRRSLSGLMEKAEKAGLTYCPQRKTGAIFHMLSCWEPEGKCGATFIGETPEEAMILEENLIKLLS